MQYLAGYQIKEGPSENDDRATRNRIIAVEAALRLIEASAASHTNAILNNSERLSEIADRIENAIRRGNDADVKGPARTKSRPL